ncbi:MAG: OmpA family protein [Acidobacteriaceae bacterium]|nr:OmpA family protein [Acidobacteriaceae bacterium]
MNSPPVVIYKKKRAHAISHGGAWKVAYADFVTAMMALFIVLWLLTSSDQVKKAVGGYFQDPKGYGKQVGTTIAGTGESMTSKLDMSQIRQKLEEAMKKAPEFQSLKDHVVITVTGEGLRIELMETEQGMFFDSGSPHPSQFGSDLLVRLAHELGRLPNRLLIEGHTDSSRFGSQNTYTNWELSTDRANAARQVMQQNGLRSDQVSEIRGYADQRPRDAANPLDPSNRRISVIVKYLGT